jgi:hypothetical protein
MKLFWFFIFNEHQRFKRYGILSSSKESDVKERLFRRFKNALTNRCKQKDSPTQRMKTPIKFSPKPAKRPRAIVTVASPSGTPKTPHAKPVKTK